VPDLTKGSVMSAADMSNISPNRPNASSHFLVDVGVGLLMAILAIWVSDRFQAARLDDRSWPIVTSQHSAPAAGAEQTIEEANRAILRNWQLVTLKICRVYEVNTVLAIEQGS